MQGDFHDFTGNERAKINRYLQKYFTSIVNQEAESSLREFLYFAQNFVLQGGRRLHPISMIETFKGLASENDLLENGEEIYKASIAIELLHISSLMIDDLVDHEEYRRGKKTFHRFIGEQNFAAENIEKAEIAEYETASAIYGGNLTSYFGAFIINNSKFHPRLKSKAMNMYMEGLRGVTRGHVLDEYYKFRVPLNRISLENYLILTDKRAKQMETAAGLGAILGNARETQMRPLMAAMNKIGVIEQMQNDLNGTFGDAQLHDLDKDIKSGQATILTVLAYQQAEKADCAILDQVLGNNNASSEEVEEVRQVYLRCGALDFVKMYGNSLKNDIYNLLQEVYPGLRQPIMNYFTELLTYITNFKG